MDEAELHKAIAAAEVEMRATQFVVSTCIRSGFSPSKDTFISVTIQKEGLNLKQLPLYVTIAQRKVTLMALVDASVKGIIAEPEMKQAREAHMKNYDRIIERLLPQPGV